MRQRYVLEDGKLVRTNPFCPRCGAGVMMADKGESWSCGNAETDTTRSSLNYVIVNNVY